jgi:MFS family permease
MSVTSSDRKTPGVFSGLSPKLPFYYGWVIVVVAAAGMVATLPGRSHGLGMITERLLDDPAFDMDRVDYSNIHLWATLLGAAFCLPCGKLIDRYGLRTVLTGTVLCLAVVVLAMTQLTGVALLFVAITLTRGFGQSALSVVSITMVGKWFSQRLSFAMAGYTVLLSLGFIGASLWAKEYKFADWRVVWTTMGLLLLFGMAPLGWLLTRNSPEQSGLSLDGFATPVEKIAEDVPGHTLAQALRSPAFWVFGLAVSVYGLIAAGVSLFNQSILNERGFSVDVFYNMLALTTAVALLTNFPAGLLAQRLPVGRMLAAALVVLAAALFWLPQVETLPQIIIYSVAMGVSGSAVTVIFFMIWGHAFGRAHLGRIQGAAQMMTVFASAFGPKLLAESKARTGSYTLMFYSLAVVVSVLAVCAWFVPIPRPEQAAETSSIPNSLPVVQET